MEQLNLFGTDNTPPISIEDVFAAYYECRKNKRRSPNALRFEMNLEENLVQLWRELNDGTYEIGQSVAFIVTKPVKREVFAANFRDRIVHHLLIRKLGRILDMAISPHSYSCRKGMGTLYGVRRVYDYMRQCSQNWTRDCYVLRLDIRAFFMHIRHDKLVQMLTDLIRQNYAGRDKGILLRLVHQIVTYLPQQHCVMTGNRELWQGLPRSKSLFFARGGRGLPIGNLTSQIFANFYLNPFDRFVAGQSGVFYGRYVDDMVVIHRDKSLLLRLLRQIRGCLREKYHLILHPRKTILQHYAKGFAFVGAFLLPRRIYAGRRLKQQFWVAVRAVCAGVAKNALSVINSYLGFLRHYQTLRLRLRGWRVLGRVGLCTNQRVLKVIGGAKFSAPDA